MSDNQQTVEQEDTATDAAVSTITTATTTATTTANTTTNTTSTTDGKNQIMTSPPKRSRTAYFIFMASKRSEVKAHNPKATIGTIAKILGKQWKGLTPDQQTIYTHQAKLEKIQYLQLLKLYQQQHPNISTNTNTKSNAKLNANTSTNTNKNTNTNTNASLDQQAGVLSFPLARIRKICKLDPDVKGISKEAAMLVTKAAELFTARLGIDTLQMAQMQKRRKLMTQDVVDVTQLKETFHFLKEDLADLSHAQKLKGGAAIHGNIDANGTIDADGTIDANGTIDADIIGSKNSTNRTTKQLSVKAAAAVANTKPLTSFFAKK